MAQANGMKTAKSPAPEAIAVEQETASGEATSLTQEAIAPEVASEEAESEMEVNPQDIDECLSALKTLLSTVEKLQKARLDVGDIKPLLVRMLDGELVSGDELEQLKTGITGLTRLIRAYSDHQAALSKAQPARELLDHVLK
jgi:Fic family protein